jgi:hypothetical protein
MLTTKEARAHVKDIVAEATLGINGFFNQRRGRVRGIVAVTLGINGLLGLDHPVPLVAFLSIPASVLYGGIAFHRGARGLGGTAIALGAIGFVLIVFILVTYLFMLAR